jgi:hypothetical protein
MNLQLSDEQTAALETELRDIVENDRYQFSPRIRTLREILHMIRPEPAREPLPRSDITSRHGQQLRDAASLREQGEIRTRPADDAWECGGCTCSADRMVPGPSLSS